MPSLREVQQRFADALFDDAAPAPAEIPAAGGAGAAGFGVYRNNLRGTFRRALALDFPAIEALLGANRFEALAREFQDQHPSRSGDLQHIGAPFAAFLARRHAGTADAHLGEVAAFEWSLQTDPARGAAPPLDVAALGAALAAVPSARYGEVRLRLHARCRLLRTGGGATLLLRDLGPGTACDRPDAAECALLAQLDAGLPLAAALDAALALDAGFDLTDCLQRWTARGVFGALQVPAADGFQAASDSG